MEIKEIYRGKEFKFYDKFMSLREELISDFLRYSPNFGETGNNPSRDQVFLNEGVKKQFANTWCPTVLKYDPTQMETPTEGFDGLDQWEGNTPENFPTAYKLYREFPECYFSGYTILSPHSVIKRHTGSENRNGKYIRIHIPLIVPEGDIGFEVAGEEVDWSDLFAFNNQRVHSAWNNTDYQRLVFIIDLPRSICDLPDGIPWTRELDANTPPFPKGEMPEKDRKKLLSE
jgi:hypothetical protein